MGIHISVIRVLIRCTDKYCEFRMGEVYTISILGFTIHVYIDAGY